MQQNAKMPPVGLEPTNDSLGNLKVSKSRDAGGDAIANDSGTTHALQQVLASLSHLSADELKLVQLQASLLIDRKASGE
jgi:hypothetical protein